MKLLGLDTSGDACSAALLVDGAVSQRLEREPRRHGELILGMLQGLLGEAGLTLRGLDAVAFGRGPGSFTGVRIAVAVAQGVAFGAGLPTVPVSTLAALAHGECRRSGRRRILAALAHGECRRSGHRRILAALDARMGEVYWGRYEMGPEGGMVATGEESVCPPELVPLPQGDGWWGAGPGWSVHESVLRERIGAVLEGVAPEAICEAQDIVRLAAVSVSKGELTPPELAQPVYLRDRVTDRR